MNRTFRLPANRFSTPSLLLRRAAMAVAFLSLLPLAAPAQFGLPAAGEKKVTWTARFDPAKAAPGQTATLQVAVDIAEGWHIYGMNLPNKGPIPTTFEVNWPKGWTPVGDWTPSVPPHKAFDSGFQFEVTTQEGKVDFRHEVRIPSGQTLGPVEIKGRVRSQACNAKECLPPKWTDWTATLQVVTAAEAPPPAAGKTAGKTTATPVFEQKGFGAFLLLAIGAGLASLLTPCVFPMIPITVSFFTKRTYRTPRHGIMLAVIYALGIVATFTLLGLILSGVLGLLNGGSGAGAAQWIASSPWVNLVLTAIFIGFALSLFGLFDIQLPTGLANKLQGAGGGRSDVIGALIMAVVFTVTSFTCTVQFVGALLVAAARGNYLWPGIGMIVYSAAFASPFFLLALFPQALSRLPRSGPWLHSTKVVMGFLELAAAFKFISNSDLVWRWGFFNRELVLAAWTTIALFTGLYLLGMIHMKGESGGSKEIGSLRMLLSMAFVSLGLYLASGLVGVRLQGLIETYLPPRLVNQTESATAGTTGPNPIGVTTNAQANELPWIRDYDNGLALAKKQNRPVFIDFTGVTCTNCRWMEINIFSRPKIRDILHRYVLLQLYTDTDDPTAQQYQKIQADRFGTVALPYYVILHPDGTVVDTRGGIVRNPDDFARFLRQGLKEG